MKVELLTKDKEKQYSEFLLNHDHSLFNASLLFRDFLCTLLPGATPYYFLAIDEGQIVGALPSFLKKGPFGPVLNAMPWFGSNPGIVADNDMAKTFLLQAFENTAKWTGCFSSTFISPPNQDNFLYETFFDNKDALTETRKGLITEIPIFQNSEQFANDLLAKVHPKTRNQIIKSTETCLAFESSGPDDWDFLKRVHQENMAEVGAPAKNKEFDIIRKHFRKGHDYKLYVALTNDTSATRVAALLVERFNKTVEYITPVIDHRYRHLCPMHLLVFSAMGDAAQQGFRYWNWGGTRLPQQEGVYHFKKRWGADETEYKYYTQIFGTFAFDVKPNAIIKHYPGFYVLPFSLLEV